MKTKKDFEKKQKLFLKIGCVAAVFGISIIAFKCLSGRESQMTDLELLRTMPKDELINKRKELQKIWCDVTASSAEQAKAQLGMNSIDKVLSEIEWAGVKPYGPGYSREDGYNLYRPG